MTPQDSQTGGLARSASLLRALGSRAAPVWAALDPSDAAKLTKAMESSSHCEAGVEAAAGAFLNEVTSPNESREDIWEALSNLPVHQLGTLLHNEHPQVIALVLTHLSSPAAAAFVRDMPPQKATDILQRMLDISPAHSGALKAIETQLAEQAKMLHQAQKTHSDATVARLFDALPAETGEKLLGALHAVNPQADGRIRALMFTFEDLADLSAAGLQTLLSRTPRETLIMALKGVTGEVENAFYKNMTQRAGALLREEISALGPCPRKEVEASRTAMVSLARNLMEAGDIHAGGEAEDKDLIL